MDTGAYMANQMDDLIETGIKMQDAFNIWVFEACELRAKSIKKDVHDLFPFVDLTDAKLSFIDGETSEKYSKIINFKL